MRTTSLAALLCVGVVGCHHHGLPPGDAGVDMAIDMAVEDQGISDMTSGDGSAKIVTYRMFAADYAQAYCAHLMTCGRVDAAQLALCVENYTFPKGWDIDSEILKNRLEINELQCLEALSSSRCDGSDNHAWQTRCLRYFNIPHQGNGAACLGDEECMSGYCKHSLTDAGTAEQNPGCPGTCAQPDPVGAACISNKQCGPNAHCDETSHQCKAFPGLGEACDRAIGCQPGLLCPLYGATPKCEAPTTQTKVGGPCDPLQGIFTDMPSCAAGMYCQLQYDTSMPPQNIGATCQPKFAKNDSCESADPSKSYVGVYGFTQNQCEDGTRCYSTNGSAPTCQPYGSANDACKPGTCKEGLYCDQPSGGSSGTCKPLIADGEACSPTSNACASYRAVSFQQTCLVADPDAGTNTTCGTPKWFGDSCLPAYESALCAPASGVPGSAYCSPTTGGKGVCAPKCQ